MDAYKNLQDYKRIVGGGVQKILAFVPLARCFDTSFKSTRNGWVQSRLANGRPCYNTWLGIVIC